MSKSNKPNLRGLLFLTWKVINRYLSTGHLEFSINGIRFNLTQHGDLEIVGARIITIDGKALFLGSEPSKEQKESILMDVRENNAKDIKDTGYSSLHGEMPIQTTLPLRKCNDNLQQVSIHRE